MQDICAHLTGEDLCWIALCYANIFGVAVFNASMLDWIGFHLSSIYMHCPWSSSRCSSRQGICAKLTREGHIKCNGNQCIYAWLTGWSICLLYICIILDLAVGVAVWKASMLKWLGGSICLLYKGIVLDLAVSVVVCKTSMLKWLGVHLPSIYMHCLRSISGFSILQGIYAWLTWEDLCCMAFCYFNVFGVVVFNAHMFDWLGVYLTSIYRHCPRSSSGCSNMQGICAWLTEGSICLLYTCIVLDLIVGVNVCKTSVLYWLGRTYAGLHCGMLIYLV